MNITINRTQLSKVLNLVAKAIPPRSTLPVLQSFELHADDRGLRIAATNLEYYLRARVTAEVQAWGRICVGLPFIEYVNRVPGEELRITLDKEKLCVEAARDYARFPTIDAGEFPEWAGNLQPLCCIETAILNSLVRKTIFAAAKDESRPLLCGINLEMGQGVLRLVTADGFRLATASAPVPGDAEFQATVPAKAMALLAAFECDEIVVSRAQSETSLIFSSEAMELQSQLLMGKYPDWQQIVPKAGDTKVIVNREEFVQACKLASVFAKPDLGRVKLEIGNDQIVISARSSEAGESNSVIGAQVEGNPITLAFNVNYLLDAARSIDTEQVIMEFQPGISPAVLRPDADEDHLCIVMPMTQVD